MNVRSVVSFVAATTASAPGAAEKCDMCVHMYVHMYIHTYCAHTLNVCKNLVLLWNPSIFSLFILLFFFFIKKIKKNRKKNEKKEEKKNFDNVSQAPRQKSTYSGNFSTSEQVNSQLISFAFKGKGN